MTLPPHPVPYQGSKRALAPRILAYVPAGSRRLLEPFAGSAAVTLAAAQRGLADAFVLGDSLPALAGIWRQVLADPAALAARYREVWAAQHGRERAWYDEVRAAFNRDGEPGKLLFLLARCVKNAVRFNRNGEFNQSPDRRRRGMHPDRMERALLGAHRLLRGRAEARAADFAELLAEARPGDFAYLDPPWQGTSGARDRRYHEGLDLDRLVRALETLQRRGVPFAVSFDGRCGARAYGLRLPRSLGLRRVELRAGRSSQATLHGRAEITYESLYLSPGLRRRRP